MNLAFLLKNKKQRTDLLTEFAAFSHHFAPLTQQLTQLPVDISFKWWSSPAFYEPALGTKGESPCPTAKLILSSRYGINTMLHCWLHELVHLEQDRLGLMPEILPKEEKEEALKLLNVQTDIQRYLFCEALAATKAIIATLEMRKAGDDRAWNGAFAMKEFRTLAEKATSLFDSQATLQEVSTQTLLNWYDSPIRRRYETRALAGWKRHYERATASDANIEICDVPLFEFITLATQILPSLAVEVISDRLSNADAIISAGVKNEVESALQRTGTGKTIPLPKLSNHSLMHQI